MQREWQFLPELSREWRSKLFDGVLATVVLCLTWLIVTITIRPVEVAFGAPGLLVYALGLVAAALYGLQQALSRAHSEPTRAWFGMAEASWPGQSFCLHPPGVASGALRGIDYADHGGAGRGAAVAGAAGRAAFLWAGIPVKLVGKYHHRRRGSAGALFAGV